MEAFVGRLGGEQLNDKSTTDPKNRRPQTCGEVEGRPGGLVGHRHQQHEVGGKELQREG